MKIIIPLTQFEHLILIKLYYLTYLGESLTPIVEKQLRVKMKHKSSIYSTLKRLVEKGYVMTTKSIKDGKMYYALSPEGKKMFDLLGLISELNVDMTDRERIKYAIMDGHNPQYYINTLKEKKMYATMCCKCFSIRYVKESKKFAKNNLCIPCQVAEEKQLS